MSMFYVSLQYLYKYLKITYKMLLFRLNMFEHKKLKTTLDDQTIFKYFILL